MPVFLRSYTFSVAGSANTTIWTICSTDDLNCSISGVQYDAGTKQTPTQNQLSVQFYKSEGVYTSLNQQVYIGTEWEQAQWNRTANTTTLMHVRPDPATSQTLAGMVLLQIWTNKGNVVFKHT